MAKSLTKLTDWIKVYDDIISEDFCERLIAYFDTPELLGKGSFKESWRRCQEFGHLDHTPFFQEFKNFVKTAFEKYRGEVDNGNLYFLKLVEAPNVFRYEAKDPDGPNIFHRHADNWNTDTATRQISIIIYLNDVEEGGATTFTDLDTKVTPKKGRILLFPSFFTYLHQGEAPISNSKYIIVSWLHYEGKTTYRTHSL